MIALTASALVSERQRAADAGMTGFATKPLDPKALIRTVRSYVEKARGEPTAIRLRTAGQPLMTSVPPIPGLDLAELRATLDLAEIKNLLKLLFVEFADVADSATPDLADPYRRAQWAAHLHKLVGGAGVLCASEIHRLAVQAERALRSDTSVENMQQACRELSAAMAKLREQTQAFLDGPSRPAAVSGS